MVRNMENLLKKESSKVDNLKELGVTGLVHYDGIIGEEWQKELSDMYRANKWFSEMADQDAICGAILTATDMIIRRVKWYIKPGGISQKALEKARFLEECKKDFEGQNYNDIISEIFSMLPIGWSLTEKTFRIRNEKYGSKYNDNKLGWRRWGFRSQTTLEKWVFSKNNKLIGLIQVDPISFKRIFIPIEKCMLFRTRIFKDNPQGKSIFRNAFKSYYFKKNFEQFEAIQLEHSALGIIVVWIPKDQLATNSESTIKTNIERSIRKIQSGTGGALILPLEYDGNKNKKYDITLLETSSKSGETEQISKAIERYDLRIAQSCLYDIVMIGTKGSGSYALAENKSNSFVQALGTYLEIVRNIINENAVIELFKLNGDDMQELPTIEFEPVVKADLKVIGQYLKDLFASGAKVWPNRELNKFLMTIADMPNPTDEELDNEENAADAIKRASDENDEPNNESESNDSNNPDSMDDNSNQDE